MTSQLLSAEFMHEPGRIGLRIQTPLRKMPHYHALTVTDAQDIIDLWRTHDADNLQIGAFTVLSNIEEIHLLLLGHHDPIRFDTGEAEHLVASLEDLLDQVRSLS